MTQTFENLIEQDLANLDQVLVEVRAVRKKVVRKGRVIRKKDCPKGYRLSGGKCTRQSSQERRNRKVAGRKAARKGKSARRRNFKKSIRLRQRRKLKRS